jgi:putative SbcD/Mre11-related phosphoesterase
MRRIDACSRVELVTGNHDRGIEQALGATGTKFLECGRFVLAHGDVPLPSGNERMAVIGHEHPAIGLGDGVRGARFPCFLWGPALLVLPAFSKWAAGSDVRSGRSLSPIARERPTTHAVAIMGEKLLKVPLQ